MGCCIPLSLFLAEISVLGKKTGICCPKTEIFSGQKTGIFGKIPRFLAKKTGRKIETTGRTPAITDWGVGFYTTQRGTPIGGTGAFPLLIWDIKAIKVFIWDSPCLCTRGLKGPRPVCGATPGYMAGGRRVFIWDVKAMNGWERPLL